MDLKCSEHPDRVLGTFTDSLCCEHPPFLARTLSTLTAAVCLWECNLCRCVAGQAFFFFFKVLFIYLIEKESRGEAEPEGEADSGLSMEPDTGLELRFL